MSDGINTELFFDLIGSKDNACFLISPTGELRIQFAKALNFVQAPARQLRFEDVGLLFGNVHATEIRYECPTEKTAYWKVTISRADGEVLQQALRENAKSRKEIFGED